MTNVVKNVIGHNGYFGFGFIHIISFLFTGEEIVLASLYKYHFVKVMNENTLVFRGNHGT